MGHDCWSVCFLASGALYCYRGKRTIHDHRDRPSFSFVTERSAHVFARVGPFRRPPIARAGARCTSRRPCIGYVRFTAAERLHVHCSFHVGPRARHVIPPPRFLPPPTFFFSRLESLPRGLSFFFSSSSISPPPSEIPFAFYFFRSFLRPSGSSTGRFRLEPTVDSLSFSFRKGDRFQSKGRRFLSSLPIRPVGNGMEVPRAT